MTRGTIKQAIEGWPVRLATWAFLLGMWWMSTKYAIAQKADREDVSALGRDLKVIKILLCRQTPTDSYCAEKERP